MPLHWIQGRVRPVDKIVYFDYANPVGALVDYTRTAMSIQNDLGLLFCAWPMS